MHGQTIARHYLTGEPMDVIWENGIITVMEQAADAPPELWIAPPLVDLQINGYGGVDFQQDHLTAEDLLSAARKLQSDGCVHCMPTLVTDDWPRMMARLANMRKLRSESEHLMKSIIGWHIEGPFLSAEPGYCGAHNPAKMLGPTAEHLAELRQVTGSDPVLLTLAPERPNAISVIKQAVSLGIKVSLGHTNASLSTIGQAIEAGATGFTHLGNGCPRQLDRHDNILWRIFETEGLTVSLIPDTIHVSPALFRLVHATLPPGSIYYTTDAMSAAGAPPGRYTLGAMTLDVGEDQVVRQPGQSNFAGSALRPIQGILRAATMLGCSWRDAWPRYSESPARFMGLDMSLRVGQPANFLLIETPAPGRLNFLRAVTS